MSPTRKRRASTTKRGAYRPPRDRREVWTAVAAAALIVIVTASFVWFVRPNRESSSVPTATNPDPVITTTTVPADPSATTAPADTTTPTGTTATPAGG